MLSAPAANDPLGLRDRAILETMYSAGLRVSEAVGMNDCDLDLVEGVVRIRGKGRRERLSPIGTFAAKALARWLKVRTLAATQARSASEGLSREGEVPAEPSNPKSQIRNPKSEGSPACFFRIWDFGFGIFFRVVAHCSCCPLGVMPCCSRQARIA